MKSCTSLEVEFYWKFANVYFARMDNVHWTCKSAYLWNLSGADLYNAVVVFLHC